MINLPALHIPEIILQVRPEIHCCVHLGKVALSMIDLYLEQENLFHKHSKFLNVIHTSI